MSAVDEVAKAVSRGFRTSVAISEVCGLGLRDTRTYLTRLRGRGLVESVRVRGVAGCRVEYHAVGAKCLLSDVW